MRIKIENGQLKFSVQKSSNGPASTSGKQGFLNFIFSSIPNFLIVVLFPALFLINTSSNGSENETFRLYLISIGLATTLFFAQFLLGKSKIMFEPNGLVGVLIFNLIITTTVILNTSNSVSSTFAAVFFRSGAGISLISFIAMFYLISYFSNRYHSIFESKYLRFAVLSVFFISSLDILFDSAAVNSLSLIYFCVLSLLVLGIFPRINKTNKLIRFITLVTLFVIMFIKLPSVIFSVSFAQVLFVLVLSILPISFIKIFNKRKDLKSVIKYYYLRLRSKATSKKSISFTKKGIFEFIDFKLNLLTPILILVGFIYLLVKNQVLFSSLFNEFSRFLTQFGVLTDGNITGLNFQHLFIGKGVDYITQGNSFASNILVSSGLLGFFSYLTIWIMSLMLSIKLYKKAQSSINMFKVFFSTLFILLAFTINMPFMLTVLWWFIFADNSVIFAKSKVSLQDNSNYRFLSIPKVKNRKLSILINIIILSAFFIISGVLVAFIIRNII